MGLIRKLSGPLKQFFTFFWDNLVYDAILLSIPFLKWKKKRSQKWMLIVKIVIWKCHFFTVCVFHAKFLKMYNFPLHKSVSIFSFKCSGESMEPTIHPGDIWAVECISRIRRTVQKWVIISVTLYLVSPDSPKAW